MIRIRDTMTGKSANLNCPREIGIYLCGVTVYDESHVGHARTIIIFDVLRRYLESKKCTVRLVQNFTDVDDKIVERAAKEGTTAKELSGRYIREYYEGFDALNIRRASSYPMATEHIPDMIHLIEDLVRRGIAYTTKKGVYFAVSKFSGYGKLSKKDSKSLRAGARVTVDEDKADPLDFALWKLNESEPYWESPWGKGRPGWHIECSTMSLKYLGESFEVHGGGRDLIFPHHENEIAQSEAHTGQMMAKVWMHVGMVTVDGEKMSKSLGNIKSVSGLLKRWSPNIIRLFCMAGHYSKPIDYTEELLKEHQTNWEKARLVYHTLSQADRIKANTDSDISKDAELKIANMINDSKNKFDEALDSDLNTHEALNAFYGLATFCLTQENKLTLQKAADALEMLKYMMGVLGLKIEEVSAARREHIEELVSRRDKLRESGAYEEADSIRGELRAKGIEMVDGTNGTIWMKAESYGAN